MFQSLPAPILTVLLPFAILFRPKSWRNAAWLLIGGIVCKGKRTVCAVLRTLGVAQDSSFSKFHRLLNCTKWSPLLGAKILFSMLTLLAASNGMLIIVVDETLERRKGKRITAKGCYRDAVRSSSSCVVKAFGLKWIVMAVLVRLPFCQRTFALPFFTVLEPSKKSSKIGKRTHKTTLDWACQMLCQILRWKPKQSITLVGDGGFATGRLAWFCLTHSVTLVSRLKINAALYAFAPPRAAGQRGRPRLKGSRLLGFREIEKKTTLPWQDAEVRGYGGLLKKVRYLTDTALWGADGDRPVPIRWVLVIDPEGKLPSLPLMCTDATLPAEKIIEIYIDRWAIEVTFEEVREHLGVETQRQWSDMAIARTTPILMALYSMIVLMAVGLNKDAPLQSQTAAWHNKTIIAFADCLMAVRRAIWRSGSFFRKAPSSPSYINSPHEEAFCLDSFMDYLASTA